MLRRFATYFIAVTLLVTSLAPLNTFASPAAPKQQRRERKLAPELETAKSGTVRVIIQSKGRSTAAQDQAVSAKGGNKRKALEALDAMVADVPQHHWPNWPRAKTSLTSRQTAASGRRWT